MESSSVSVCEAVSSVLCTLEEQRKLAYTQSGIDLVSEVDNKYPLSDVIMKSYTGRKRRGVLEGRGTVEFKDDHTYEGEFHQGVMHGQGRYVWKDGLIYEGEFSNCKITGVGKYTWPDGSSYTGQVKNGLRHGQGTYSCAVTGSTYVGEWVGGRREGRGQIKYSSSSGEAEGECYYDGDWVDNQQEGFGTRKYRSGNVYEGEWHLNERHGKGTMHWYDQGERYTGQWVKGIQHGHGEHTWLIQCSDNAQYPLCNRYDGTWELGKRQGFGTFYYANGSKYIGEWHSDLKHGMGKFVFQSGQVFEGEFKNDRMLGGRTAAEEARLLRPQTPLGSLIGDIDHSDIVAGGSITEKFNLEISRLLSETNIQHELRQIHCVLMRHITQLKKIYHHYSSLGSCPAGVGSEGFGQCSLLTQLQLWRLLMDCRVHHQDLTLHDVDYIIYPDAPPTAVHDPTHTFLMREFLQLLVFLSHHLVSSQQEIRVGGLSQKLSTFITTHLLPNACQVGGPLFSQPPTCIVQALEYQQEVWQLYQHIQSTRTDVVRLRDILLLFKERGLVTSKFPAKSIIKEMVKSSQLAVDGEDYNLEVKVVFLEFFEILLLCAQEWYKVEGAQTEPKPSVHTVTSNAEADTEVSSAGVNTSPIRVIVSTTDGESSNKQESTVRLSDNQTLEQQQEGEDREEEGGDGEGCSVAGDERDQLGVQETTEEDIEKLISSVFKEEPSDVNKELSWKEMLHAFFDEHLFAV